MESELADLSSALERDFLREYGPTLTGEVLLRALGFQTVDAFRQAVSRGQAPVPIFDLENRRGKFALSKDVAAWLAKQRMNAVEAQRHKRVVVTK